MYPTMQIYSYYENVKFKSIFALYFFNTDISLGIGRTHTKFLIGMEDNLKINVN